ncbi:MAG: 6-bladed beta-propeller [Euryarchaeota archaeon]|nr:6-bladed beta-propeller [Euryarchaeota archaeon]
MVDARRRTVLAILGAGALGAGATYFGASGIDSGGSGDPPATGTESDDTTMEGKDADDSDAGDGAVTEAFFTPEMGNTTDTPAIWYGEDDHLLVVTDKEGDELFVFDATSGEFRERIGAEGTGLNEFRYPNEVDIVDEWAFVVERDNGRVQVLRMPDGESVGTFGENELLAPYGCTIVPDSGGYDIYVTDNYEADGQEDLGERIKQYRVSIEESGIEAAFVGAFGATEEPGALEEVETIYGDPEHDRLVIADEANQSIKLYGLDGEFHGTVTSVFDDSSLDRGNDPEGIALYRSNGDGGGYWFFTEQADPSVFHVVDRESLEYRTQFSGETTANTDGVWLTQESFGPFSAGAFYADHDDRRVAAFDLADIEREIEGFD